MVSEARANFGPEAVDQYLEEYLICKPSKSKNINDIWKDFKKGFIQAAAHFFTQMFVPYKSRNLISAVKSLHGILSFLPAFQDYLYAALEGLYQDGIQHVQVKVVYRLTAYSKHVFKI